MAAQEPPNSLRLCDKCFTMLEQDATFCPECGAPCGSDLGHSEGSDSAIYPELARANLLRMRGEYKMAEEVCRTILRRYPNNTSSAGLLGDIAAESGELEDAIRWYELVLDLSPDSDAERTKLEGVHRRLKEKEALSTAEQLGLPVSRPKIGLFAGVVLVLIAAVAFAAFLLGQKTGTPKSQSGNRVNLPYEAGTFDPRPVDTSVNSSENSPSSIVGNALVEQLRTKSALGARIIDAWIDPRTNHLNLVFRAETVDDIRYVAAHLARIGLDQVSEATLVNVRGVQDGKDAFFAEVERSALVAAISTLGEKPETDQVAFADAILANEWPTRHTLAPQPSQPDPAPSPSESQTTSEPADTSSAGDTSQN